MTITRRTIQLLVCAMAGVSLTVVPVLRASSPQLQDAPASASAVKSRGTVKGIVGNSITLSTDSGPEITVVVPESARIVRTAPGQTDLKAATPILLRDLQVGDRMLLRGTPSTTGVTASSIIVMKRDDIARRQEQEREDWQKRGVGGLVSSVDAGGTITISTLGAAGKKTVLIETSKATIVRRYVPESLKFDDAKPGTVEEIKPGDQLRARGNRSGNDTEFNAEEIVSGSFRNIAGTVASVDTSKSTLTVTDLATKKLVTVKVGADAQLKKLPAMMAERIAFRLQGAPPDAGSSAAGPRGRAATGRAPAAGAAPEGEGRGSRPGGPPDLQNLLNRLPAMPLAELQKGEAVMMVATQGTANSEPTVITLLTGVDPILAAAPSGGGAMVLTPWSLGTSPAEAAIP